MKAMSSIFWFSLAALLGVCDPERVSAATVTNVPSVAYVRPFQLVFYRTNASPEVARLAEKFSSDYGLQKAQPLSDNPACCIWVEVKPIFSKPGVAYYSVQIIKDGSGMVIASSPKLLEQAVERLKKASHNDEAGQPVVPVGKFSYYGE